MDTFTPAAVSKAAAIWSRRTANPPEEEVVRVWVHYRDPLLRAGLTSALQSEPDLVVMVPDTPADLDAALRASATEVVIADYEQGMQVLGDAAERSAGVRRQVPNVLILTRRESEGEIRHALQQGARGYLILGCGIDELIEAIGTVRRGLRHIGRVAARRLADSIACEVLTGREVDVLRLVSRGLSNKAVARELDIGIGTVKSHLKAVFQKLDAHTRTEVAAVAERRGLLAAHGHEPSAGTALQSYRGAAALRDGRAPARNARTALTSIRRAAAA
jgi:DNA-binding NarL/FixJ family response regulator